VLVTSTPGGPPIEESPLHRIGTRWKGECRDLFQVQFHKEMLFISFPYQPDEPGLVARVELPPGTSHTFELTDTADATTQRVKYSHPIDGNAHFSQTGKARTTVYNQACRLDGSVGHFFSIDISGITMFRKCRSKVPSVQFTFDSANPVDPLHCAGYWLQLSTDIRLGTVGNPIYMDPDGRSTQALAIAPPIGSPLSGWILAISARRGPAALIVEPGQFRLGFVGGFAANLNNISESSSFLAMQYPPGGDISELRLIDYVCPSD
jgi:hypothetical protein